MKVKPSVMNGGIKVVFKKSVKINLMKPKKKYTYRQTSKSFQDLADDLMHVGKYLGSYGPTLDSRLRKAIKYMEEYEAHTWPMSPRKKAMILSTIQACNRDRMVKFNTSPESEHYWSS